jgi:hypothetical protein
MASNLTAEAQKITFGNDVPITGPATLWPRLQNGATKPLRMRR